MAIHPTESFIFDFKLFGLSFVLKLNLFRTAQGNDKLAANEFLNRPVETNIAMKYVWKENHMKHLSSFRTNPRFRACASLALELSPSLLLADCLLFGQSFTGGTAARC